MSSDSLLAAIVRRVDTGEVARRMVEVFRAEIEAYRRLPEEVVHGQIFAISKDNLELFFRTLAEDRGLREDELQPFRESARERAGEGLPLEDLLHAYRLGGRLGWQALIDASSAEERAALLPSVARLMEYVDRVSDAVTATYHDERRHLMSTEERRLYELFSQLTSKRPLDPPLRELADQLAIPIAESYTPFAGVLVGGPAHAHSQIAASLRARGVLALSDGEQVVGLLTGESARPAESAPAALFAIGEEAPRGNLLEAIEDTRLVLAVGTRLGHRSGEITAERFLPELLIARSPQAAATLRRRALGPLEEYAERRSGDLLETLEVFLACELDRRKAAERLHVHPNTLDYRLRRIEEITGLRLQSPDDLMLLALALKQRALDGDL
ncbi:MAG: helix-turn-helix domain-containing protein [Thermoleophilaceae bacterium]